jgi:Na+-transporting methylmalonyl-CoA/oxaloacetate decarboxylase gamma subunit
VELYWVPIGFVVVVLLLILLLARMVGNSKRREIRRKLGLPEGSRLTPEQASAVQAFESTDMKLMKSFPTMSDTQRQAMAREVLRDKGMLPKQQKKKAS